MDRPVPILVSRKLSASQTSFHPLGHLRGDRGALVQIDLECRHEGAIPQIEVLTEIRMCLAPTTPVAPCLDERQEVEALRVHWRTTPSLARARDLLP